MTKKELLKKLDYVDATRIKRQEMAVFILDNKALLKPLMQIAFKTKEPLSIRACWILEFVAKEQLNWFVPEIKYFLKKADKLENDSAMRPISKICLLIVESYFYKRDLYLRNNILRKHLTEIAVLSFDWLISDAKVATKAYAMRSLFLISSTQDWINAPLKATLERDINRHTAAYRARARQILKKL